MPFFKPYILNTSRKKKLINFLLLLCTFYIPGLFGFIFQIDKYFEPSLYFIFILIALLGDLIRVFENELKTVYFKYIIILFVLTLSILQARPFVISILDKHNLIFPEYLISDTKSLNAILLSFCLFIIILKIKIPKQYINLIPIISNSTFEVYLIHDNPLFRSILWNNILKNPSFYWSPYLVPLVILEPLIIFFICLLLVKLRVALFKKLKINSYFLT